MIGFSIRDHDYVAYAPTGASWVVNGASITSTLGGKSYFTVAVLPTKAADTDSTRTALATSYGRYAHAHVTGTKISYAYSPSTGKVNSTYAFTTEAREGTRDQDRGVAVPAPVEGPRRRFADQPDLRLPSRGR